VHERPHENERELQLYVDHERERAKPRWLDAVSRVGCTNPGTCYVTHRRPLAVMSRTCGARHPLAPRTACCRNTSISFARVGTPSFFMARESRTPTVEVAMPSS
jgi:hypothetical protein